MLNIINKTLFSLLVSSSVVCAMEEGDDYGSPNKRQRDISQDENSPKKRRKVTAQFEQFDELPLELKQEVLSHLQVMDLLRTRQANKELNGLANGDRLWSNLLQHHFDALDQQTSPADLLALATIYDEGLYSKPIDKIKVNKILKRIVNKINYTDLDINQEDNLKALVWLGYNYLSGDGVKQDFGEASSLFEEAARVGYEPARDGLAEMRDDGLISSDESPSEDSDESDTSAAL